MLESSRRTQSLEMLSEPQPSSTKDLSSPVSKDPILTQEVTFSTYIYGQTLLDIYSKSDVQGPECQKNLST